MSWPDPVESSDREALGPPRKRRPRGHPESQGAWGATPSMSLSLPAPVNLGLLQTPQFWRGLELHFLPGSSVCKVLSSRKALHSGRPLSHPPEDAHCGAVCARAAEAPKPANPDSLTDRQHRALALRTHGSADGLFV